MEEKINIAEILKDKPKGTKLYADAFGELSIEEICTEDDHGITLSDNGGTDWLFYNDGKYSWRGESILVPSKEMRDWHKFAWKKGDVLISVDKRYEIIFDKFVDDTYMSIVGKHCMLDEGYCGTTYIGAKTFRSDYFELQTEDTAKALYCAIEAKLGGKLNRQTLEVEKTQPEFKDGDIVCISGMGYLAYGIVKSIDNSSKKLEYYVLNDMSILKFEDWLSFEDKQIYPITETQQIILFDALAKENKAWDAEKKQIVDLKPKWTPKPFDRVITRGDDDSIWTANIFSHIDRYGQYVTIGCIGGYPYCIPYNEETAKLIGTTDDWKG